MKHTVLIKSKHLFCFCLAVFMTISLIACSGQSTGESAELPNSQIEADESYEESSEEESDYEESIEESVEEPIPTLDEIMYAISQYAEEEGLLLSDEANNAILDMYNDGNGETDAYSIFEYLCEEGLCKAPSTEGIIAISFNQGSTYNYKSTGTKKCISFTVQLDSIDPETGAVTHVRTFSSEGTGSCSSFVSVDFPKGYFDSNYTRLGAYVTCEDGSEHVGWIDETGTFTDVSEMISTGSSDFSGLTKHSQPRFGPDDYFYFMDETTSNSQIKRVPSDNITPENVEVMLTNVTWSTAMNPFPDGSVKNWSEHWEYYDEEMLYPARFYGCHDWISQTECVGGDIGSGGTTYSYMIYKYTLTGELDVFKWYSEQTPLVPAIKDRRNWDPVVSPDKTQVAFLSRLTSGTDQAGYLYIVPLDGGEPIKVPTEYTFTDGANGIMAWIGADEE